MEANSYRYQRPFVMKDDGADGHWIEDAAGVPLDRGQILEVLNGSLGPNCRQVVERHRRHVELSPGVGADVQRYALAVCDDILSDLPPPATGLPSKEKA